MYTASITLKSHAATVTITVANDDPGDQAEAAVLFADGSKAFHPLDGRTAGELAGLAGKLADDLHPQRRATTQHVLEIYAALRNALMIA